MLITTRYDVNASCLVSHVQVYLFVIPRRPRLDCIFSGKVSTGNRVSVCCKEGRDLSVSVSSAIVRHQLLLSGTWEE
jgi:hypothetical protein